MARKFDGKASAAQKLAHLRQRVEDWQQHHLIGLTMVSVYPPEDEASVLYTKLKKQDAAQIGIQYLTKPISLKASRHDWLKTVMEVNKNPKVQGLLVQKPSAAVYNRITKGKGEEFATWWSNIAEAIEPGKDVDCLAPWSLFLLEQEAERVMSKKKSAQDSLQNWVLPATAQAVIDIALEAVGSMDQLRQKHVVVIGRSVIVGRPAVAGFRVLGVPTDVTSSQAQLAMLLPQADIIVSATGVADLVHPEWVKPGAVLIDVGAPKPEFQQGCYEKAGFYTPVPYGVGPVTRACLLENLFKLPTLAEYATFR